MISVQGREPYLGDLIKYTFNIGLLFDAYESITFKLDMVVLVDTAKLCSLITV